MHEPIIKQGKGQYKGNLIVGEGVYFLARVNIDLHADVIIGDNSVIARDVVIFTHSHVCLTGFPTTLLSDRRLEVSPLVIGKNVYIAQRAMILPQVNKIDDYAVIGAGSVLTHDVGYGEIWAGNPARLIGRRQDDNG